MGGGVRSDGSTRSTWAPRTEPLDEETLGDKPTLQPNPSSSRVSSSTQQTSQKVLVLGTFVEFQVKTLPILRSPLSLQKEFAFLVRNPGVVTNLPLRRRLMSWAQRQFSVCAGMEGSRGLWS